VNQDFNAPTNVLTLDDDDNVNKISDAFTAQQMVCPGQGESRLDAIHGSIATWR